MTTRFTRGAVAIGLVFSLTLAGCASGAASSSDNERDSSSTSRDNDRDSGSDSGSDSDSEGDKEKDRDKETDRDKEGNSDSDRDSDSERDNDQDRNTDENSTADKGDSQRNGDSSKSQDRQENQDEQPGFDEDPKSPQNSDRDTAGTDNPHRNNSGNSAPNTGDSAKENQGTPRTETTSVSELNEGDCLFLSEEGKKRTKVDCAEPHHQEAIHIFPQADPNSRYPGQQVVEQAAQRTCNNQFYLFIGLEPKDSQYDFRWYVPGEDAWAQGARNIICVVVDDNGKEITGSLRGVKR